MTLAYVWDYDIDEDQFRALLDGKQFMGRLDSDWAAIRLLEYAAYPDIIRLLGFKRLVEGWPRWREHIRSNILFEGFYRVIKTCENHTISTMNFKRPN